jgi:uncharacterized membrane protein YdjX (TVP38/TMEM64 family)
MWRRFALLALIIALLGAWHSGAFRTFSDVDQVRALLDSWGPWAYVFFLGSFSVLQPLGIPAFFWVLPAAILWPFQVAFPLSLAGALGAASIGFLFARYLARDWVAARLPDRLRRFDDRLETHGLRAVILIRLVFLLSPPTHWLFGLSKVSYGAFALGTVLGSIPHLALVTYFGERAFRWIDQNSTLSWVVLAAIIAGALVVRRVFLARRKSKASRPA